MPIAAVGGKPWTAVPIHLAVGREIASGEGTHYTSACIQKWFQFMP